jgi:hypothetical protein
MADPGTGAYKEIAKALSSGADKTRVDVLNIFGEMCMQCASEAF